MQGQDSRRPLKGHRPPERPRLAGTADVGEQLRHEPELASPVGWHLELDCSGTPVAVVTRQGALQATWRNQPGQEVGLDHLVAALPVVEGGGMPPAVNTGVRIGDLLACPNRILEGSEGHSTAVDARLGRPAGGRRATASKRATSGRIRAPAGRIPVRLTAVAHAGARVGRSGTEVADR